MSLRAASWGLAMTLALTVVPGAAGAAHLRGAGQTAQEDPSVDFSKDFDKEVQRDKKGKGARADAEPKRAKRARRRHVKTDPGHDSDFDTPAPQASKADAKPEAPEVIRDEPQPKQDNAPQSPRDGAAGATP